MTQPGSPLWWVDRLHAELGHRQSRVARFECFYTGDHPLPVVANSFTIKEAERAYQELLRHSVTNWSSLVADAPAERLEVVGFRFGAETGGDPDGWRLWQENQLDADQHLVTDTALQTGQAFVSVWFGPGDTPVISPEHPSQCIVAYAAGSRRRRVAALKEWRDDDGSLMASLHLPGGVYKFRLPLAPPAPPGIVRADSSMAYTAPAGLLSWEVFQPPGEEWPIPNPTGVVPIIEFRANPSLRPAPFGGGHPEFETVIPIQQRINRTLFNRLITQEFQSFRQRWATGMEPPLDPETGQPQNPFKPGASTIWMTADEQVKFGEFTEADLTRFIAAVESDVQQMAAITRTPPYYLLGEMINVSGDALMAAEAGLVAKVRRHMGNFGESWEEVVRVALAFMDDPRSADMQSQVIWSDPEQRTWAATVDAVLKMQTLGVPTEALWAMLPGVTPQDVARWKSMGAGADLIGQLLAQPAPPAPV
jgi:hypothetical protein